MQTFKKAIWSVAVGATALGGLWVLGGFRHDESSILPNEQPELRVEKDRRPRVNILGMPTGGFEDYVKFTNVGRSRIAIHNVLVNEKEHCAKLGNFSNYEPPVTLFDVGGWSSFRFVCSGAIAEVRVVTDHGNATYSWR
jgi:hypothetical protein